MKYCHPSSISTRTNGFQYEESVTSSTSRTSIIRRKSLSIQCLKVARTTCGLRTISCTWATTAVAGELSMFQENCEVIFTGRDVRSLDSGQGILKVIAQTCRS